MKKLTSLILIALSLFLLTACGDDTSEPTPEVAQVTQDHTRVDDITENLLNSLAAADYEQFSKDFSAEMMDYLPKDKFDELVEFVSEASGAYISKTFVRSYADANTQYTAFVYEAEFEKEKVLVNVSFKIEGYEVEGFYLNSENLQKLTEEKANL